MAMATLIGYRVAGTGGALAATAGIYCAPVVLVTAGSSLYFRNKQRDWVRRTEIALRPLIFALIFGSTALFLSGQLGGDWLLGLALGLPVAYLNWTGRISALGGVFLTGALWWAAKASGRL